MTGPFGRFEDHEQVVLARDDEAGLTCIVAIHSTRLGPALGGTRYRRYDSDDDALTDALRLSRAMTYKNACAGLSLGGGKAVIVARDEPVDREALMRAYGRLLASLGGRYVTACDVGTTPADMSVVHRETPWATGREHAEGGSGDSGIMTAYGVFLSIEACARIVWGTGVTGRHVAVQGLGKVGGRLVGHLVEAGAKVTVADVSPEAVERVAALSGVEVVAVDDILAVDADVVSPNAFGAVLHETSVAALQAQVVCGGANNQLATPAVANLLHERGVLYAPDFVVNAGGVINIAYELVPGGYDEERARRHTQRIPATLHEVVERSRRDGVTTEHAASRLAEDRIASGPNLRFWRPDPTVTTVDAAGPS